MHSFFCRWAFGVRFDSITKVCLAPIRYQAGLKGKLLAAMIYGTPAVTTALGAEGMYGSHNSPGAVQDSTEEIVAAAILLCTDKSRWKDCQSQGVEIVKSRFDKTLHKEKLKQRISSLKANIVTHRHNNFLGQVLQHLTMQATRCMSKWIEEKNK